jgi:hypothetical protein
MFMKSIESDKIIEKYLKGFNEFLKAFIIGGMLL